MGNIDMKINFVFGLMGIIVVTLAIYAHVKKPSKEKIIKIGRVLILLSSVLSVAYLFYPVLPMWVTIPIMLPIAALVAWFYRYQVNAIYASSEFLRRSIGERILKRKKVEAQDKDC